MFPKRLPLLLPWLAWLSLLPGAAPASRAADGKLAVLQGSVKPVPPGAAYGPNDERHPYIKRAELQPAEAAGEMQFEVALKMRNFPELERRIARGEIIPFSEMAARYFPTQADYQAVSAWVAGQGFKITRQDDNHLAVFAKGSVGAIQTALRVKFAQVGFEGKDYISAVTEPSVPVALAPLLVGIDGLQPHLHKHAHIVKRPNSLTGTSEPYTPAQILHAYSANALTVTGSGQCIAIVINTFPNTSDLTTFWSTCGVTGTGTSHITEIQVVPGTLAAPSGEESLDVEWSSSIAPGANIRVYAIAGSADSLSSASLDDAYQQIYEDVTNHPEYNIHEMTMSYGGPEDSSGQAFTDTQYFAELASAGVTLFASSGDSGSGAENPASDPSVTGVGGTSLTLTSGSNINTETGWDDSGGGYSALFSRPSWQTGTGVPAGSTRCVPDVASPADPSEGAYVELDGSLQAFGGTSWGSPTWAGYCARINQARANANLTPLGLLTPKIYPLIGTSNFHDITSGNNGYAAGTGYDLVTGIGSPNVQNLVTTLTEPQATVVATLPEETTLTPNQNATFTVASSGTGAGYTYQWQRMPIGTSSFGNISASGTYIGVTTTSLTVEGVTPAMSGDEFQCLITTGTGTITTSPASTLVVDNQLVVTTLAGQPLNGGWGDGSGTNALFYYPSGVAIDGSGNIWVADFSNDVIRKVTPAGVTSTPYGQEGVSGTANGSGTSALFNEPNSVAIDSSNNIYVADSSNSTIRKITPAGVVSTFAGRPEHTGTTNGSGTSARFNNPQGVGVDSTGNVYVADTGNNTIRKINTSGSVSTLAGVSGTFGWLDGSASTALFNSPISVTVDSSGNVYVADLYNYVVRKISTSGTVSTPYGQPDVLGALDGVGTGALFNAPVGVFVDGSNNLYVADCQIPLGTGSPPPAGNTLIRRINPAGVVSTIAGTPGVTGTDNGTGPAAQFDSPQFAAVNTSGVVYIADTYNQTIRAGGLAPLITTLEGSQTVTAGQPATFSISAAGSGTITYQWYFSGTAIAGGTSSTYMIASTGTGNAGDYTVIATDPYGASTSGTYILTVNTPIPALPFWMLAGLAMMLVFVANARLHVKQTKT